MQHPRKFPFQFLYFTFFFEIYSIQKLHESEFGTERFISTHFTGEHALFLENNPFLEYLLLPLSFTSDKSFRIRGNRVLNPRNIRAIMILCKECDLQDPGGERAGVNADSFILR